MNGFSFMGIHSSTFGVYYIPDESSLFDDRSDYEVYDEDVDWHDGGIYYGRKVKPREFSLDCYYEDIPRKTYEKMKQWLSGRHSGRLIFDDKPWKYYDVYITKKPSGKQYSQHEHGMEPLYSGTFSITFTAYEPFGKLEYSSYDTVDTDGVTRYCGMLEKSKLPAAPELSDRRFIFYNCGTETAPTIIRVGGTTDKDGFVIRNETTGQKCRLIALPPSPAYLELDSRKGSVTLVDPSTNQRELMFEYHDYGFIDLEPSGLLYDEVLVAYTSGSNTVTVYNKELDQSHVGRYLYLGGKWMRIIAVTKNGVVLNGNMEASGEESSTIVVMNQMAIEGNVTLTKFEMEYTPLVH